MGWNTDFESGRIDDFDFTITDAIFENGQYGIQLKLTGNTDDLDVPTTTIWVSVGTKGWTTKDGGETIVHESGKDRGFNKNSYIAKWLTRMIDDFGMEPALKERGGDPKIANSWVGITFHMKNESFTSTVNGDVKTTDKSMPVAFVGFSDTTTTAAAASSVASPEDKIAAAKAKAAAKATGGDLKSRVVDTLKQHSTFEAGQSAALEIDGVTDDDEILASLMSEDGLWAEVQAAV